MSTWDSCVKANSIRMNEVLACYEICFVVGTEDFYSMVERIHMCNYKGLSYVDVVKRSGWSIHDHEIARRFIGRDERMSVSANSLIVVLFNIHADTITGILYW